MGVARAHDHEGIVLGTVGSPWRAVVTPRGRLLTPEGATVLDWWVAADDRWHDPAVEPTVRQRRLLGAPVAETLVRVPGGDVVQRLYGIAAGEAALEVENASPLPVAVAVSRPLSGARSTPPPPGAPAGAKMVVPLAHRATVRFPLRAATGRPPPAAVDVARGWVAHTERGARFVAPDVALAANLVTMRANALLGAWPAHDPVAALLGALERGRLGPPAVMTVEAIAEAARHVARRSRRGARAWEDDAALAAAAELLAASGQQVAAADVDAIRRRRRVDPDPPAPPDGPAVAAWLARMAARPTPEGVDLFPNYPAAWTGQGVEVHGVPVGTVTVSAAVRWHGTRPALLWDVEPAVALTCGRFDPRWTTTAARGEALLAPQPRS
jgi:hypothetical protein